MRKWFSKFGLALMLAAITTAAIPQVTYSAPDLSQEEVNTPSDWAKAEIEKAKQLNLATESVDGQYKSFITREEFSELAVKLYEALTGKEYSAQKQSPFDDTENPEVVAANSLGIVNGIGDGEFAPDNTATREEVSVMLYRTLKSAKPAYKLSLRNEYIFADQSQISKWAKEAAGYLYATGVISGVGDNSFNPGGNTTREEAIVLSKRLYEKFSVSEAKEIASRAGVAVSRGDTRSPELDRLRTLIPAEMGKPYLWGGTGPNSYDCSGLVYSLFGKLGISLPRVAASQATAGTYVAKEDLQYGDLVFFARDGKNVNHTGIYVGNGEFVHSPQTGDVVKITTLMSGYYANTYYTARRVIN